MMRAYLLEGHDGPVSLTRVSHKSGLSIQEQFIIYFQDDSCGGYFGFLIGNILAIFDLQVTPILPTMFLVNWPFGSGVQNRFVRWQPSRISDQQDFSNFDL